MDTAYLCLGGLLTLLVILTVKYGMRRKKKGKVTTIPGLDMTDPELGNLPDITKAGSLHQFLMTLHQKYGDIVSFWWGKQMTVSIASPELFKQHARVFNRPLELNMMFEPLLTSASIMYANGPEGQARHAAYSRCFSGSTMTKYLSIITKTSQETVQKIQNLPKEQHIPLREYAFAFAIKTILLSIYGKSFNDDKEIMKLKRSYDYVWNDMDQQLTGDRLVEGTERMKLFKQECNNLHSIMSDVLKKARENPSDEPSQTNFLDVITKMDISPEERSADMVTMFVAGFHTTGLLLTWGLYYLALYPDIQQKAAQEATEVAGNNPLGQDAVDKLVYIRQIIDETLRCSILAPYASRYSDDDCQLGGHHIPGGTPVIHALGVSSQDPERWPQPEKFDPDRFNPINRKQIPSCGFEPFGYAGKRKCPGYRFSLIEATVFLAEVLRSFKVRLVPGQEVVSVHGLVTQPQEEIWVMFETRE